MKFLKEHFRLLTLDEAIHVINGKRKTDGSSVLLTFDDGYVDNYQVAYDVPKEHGVQGIFFLPTYFIGTSLMPWWDMIAYIVKHSSVPTFRLSYPEAAQFDVAKQGWRSVLRAVLSLSKSPATRDMERFLTELEEASGTSRPVSTTRYFLNWPEAAEMLGGGMAFGSHTHRHEILSSLTAEKQYEELSVSKRLMEESLGTLVAAVAYPVGSKASYDTGTCAAVARAGYEVGFTFHGGFNRAGSNDRYTVGRLGIDSSSTLPRFCLQTTLASVTDSYWF